MPELPEVETVRRTLAQALVGRRIIGVVFGAFTGCVAGVMPEALHEAVSGHRVVDVGRRGKYLLIGLDSARTLAVHLRMTGELRLVGSDFPESAYQHLAFQLDDGRELRFSDVRKFGRIRLLDPAALGELDQALGPEPLDPDLTAPRFAAMLAERRRAVKGLLLDQGFIAGIGNIYADEALFQAGIHPLRAASSLSPGEAGALLDATRCVLRQAIDHRGTTLRNYRDGLGGAGTNQLFLAIYGRPAGEPCPRCGSPVQRIVVAQRGTRYCPVCQPAPEECAPTDAVAVAGAIKTT